MNEHLTKALHFAEFAADDLRKAGKQAGPVESIVIMGMIQLAETLRQRIAELIEASEASE